MPKRSKPPTRAELIEAERRALARTLKRCKVDTLRAAGVKSARPAFPDLNCAKPNVAPLSQCKGGNGYKRTKAIAVPDGFHIGTPHKQGLMLMPNREVEWSGAKKS